MKRVALVAGLVAAAVAAGGAFAGDPLSPQKRHTAADMAKARSIVLHAADLGPGWKSEPPGPDSPIRCKNFQIDEHDLVETGDADSRIFERQTFALWSGASLYRTAAMAGASWQRAIRPGLPACLAELARKQLTEPGLTVQTASAGKVAFARLAPSTVAYRFVFVVKGQAGSLNLYSDAVFMRNGRVLAGVLTFSAASPFPADVLRKLAALTAKRMA